MSKIAVVVPTYNVEPYIVKCIESLLKQSFDDFEIHVVDDGSPANEQALVMPYVESHPDKIHYLRKENGGYGSVLEYAFKNLSSEYILICDPDDWLEPEALKTLYDLAQTHHSDVTCGARFLSYSDSPEVFYDKMFSSAFVYLKEESVYQRNESDFGDVYLIENAPHAKLFRRSLLSDLAFPKKITNTDALLFYYALFNAQRVVYTPKPLAYYLIDRSGNSVTDIKPKVVDEMNQVHQLILSHAKKYHDLSDSFYFQMFTAFYYICDRTDVIKGDQKLVFQKLIETGRLVDELTPDRHRIHRFYRSLSNASRSTDFKYGLFLNPLLGKLVRHFWYLQRLSRRKKSQFLTQPVTRIAEEHLISVSVIVPVYNVEKYLSKCLESLVHQSLDSIEILVVNDGTKDNSQAIIDEYARRYPNRIIGLVKSNGGLSDARNFGLKHAQGEFVAFIDSDDWVDLTMMEKLYQKAKLTQSDIAVCDMDYVYEDGHHESSSGGNFTICDVHENPDILTINNSACNKLYKTSLFSSIEFEKGIWYEDLATTPKLISIAHRIVKVNEPLYKYYQRWNSIVHTQNPKVFDIYTAVHSVKRFLIQQGSYPLYKDYLNRMSVVHGADLTTVRIKDFDDQRIEYLKKNLKQMNSFYPLWIVSKTVLQAPLKKKIVFILLRFHLFSILLWLYDRKANHE